MDIVDSKSFRIVCVGASAGGLEALIAFFKVLPRNINMAFVLVQHLEPYHKSALADILARETSLIIQEAKNNLKLKPAHVYVITPNTLMAVSRRRLKISTRTKRTDGRYLPIDFFMASLAQEEKADAIGIVLSGTGFDGTQGAKAIKAKGGIVFVQDENTARYFGMPQSVIAAGSADFVLPPGDIAREIVRLKSLGGNRFKKTIKSNDRQNDFKHLLVLLRDLTGVDFIHYKEATITRRIGRRMAFHNIESHAGYYDYLKKNPAEADLLRKDILIPVTSFFRDPAIFAALKKKVFPYIINKRSPQNPVRLWVSACSSGEEVYSLAIFLYEFFEERKIKPHIQVFGTDLSEANIERARAGLYAQDISRDISPARLRKFFIKTEAGYKIAKYIRDFCIFAKHDITIDPPLSNMDIVSCRNLLIYLDVFLQNKALSMLHYALKPKGFLVLGTSESVMTVPGFFSAVDKKQKIYSKNIVPRKTILSSGMPISAQAKTEAKPRKAVKKLPVKSAPAGNLNAISEEKDTINEELKAANEEIQSSNEELQSMNEELETSKEELQSTNEELVTLNEELQNKNTELTHLNSDLSNVFSSTNIPIIIVGNDLRIKRFTPTARKVMNLIPTDVDRPIGDIRLNIDIADLEAMILGVIDDMVPKESEVKDKEGRWYSVRIRPYRTIDNKIDGAIIALVDIDAIKRSREEAQGAFEYSQAIIETMREPLVVLDKDARVLSVNKSFCDTFKADAFAVKGKLFYELGAREWDDPGLKKLLGEILPKKSQFNDFKLSFDFPGIGQKTMVLNGRQIKLHGKESPLILLVIEDITKRKKAEDVLKRDNKVLDKMVGERSKELLRLQLELINSRHLSAIGTLAATVAHELRNPLTDITLLAHRIKKISHDPQVESILAGIKARVSESDQIINNILIYSKSAVAHYASVKINDILKGAISHEAQKFPIGKISIKEKIDSTEDLFIEADPVRIKEVFHNILLNAFEAVDADTGVIEIESELRGGAVAVSIKDNGVGIARKDLKNISSPFFTTKTKGTGLGLALCKQVVLLHGGSLAIKSVRGKGTTVTVTLPIHKHKDG